MLAVLRFLTRLAELAVAGPLRLLRPLIGVTVLNPRLGPLRHVATAAVVYVAFALVLVYVVAPLRGTIGAQLMSEKLRYDAERWLSTAVYDARGNFVGIFDPRLDSRRDFNFTGQAIEVGDYVANPDHKSIPVREVPEHYWNCLLHHEDRYLGGPLNPYGIDLLGVLKIPYSSIRRSIAAKRPRLGVGGSTLPMQFARVIYDTPPSTAEGSLEKLRRKIGEWWLAPVIYHELTRGGDFTPLKQWAANHIWLAQRTGGQPLHGVEVTSRIVFGKEAKDLSVAEQFVLASAVNKPIILLSGNEKLNEVRLDRWRYITEVRAGHCAERLISDPAQQKQVMFDLLQMAGGPPDPRVKPRLQEALERHAPTLAKRAQANPVIRANALLPSERFGIREEMKQAFGFDWRTYVRGVTTTFDVTENLAFRDRIRGRLSRIDGQWNARLNAGFTLDPEKIAPDRKSPSVVVVAANHLGEIVRYYESGETAPYFGSPAARSRENGGYDPARESRAIASTGKVLAAIAIANEQRDGPDTPYTDPFAPERGADTCEKGAGARPGPRRAIVAFACSLNAPLISRTAALGQDRIRRLIDTFALRMPPPNADGEGTPPSTAAVLGLVSGSPQRVHQIAGVVLASLIGQGSKTVRLPSLVRAYDFTSRESAAAFARDRSSDVVPSNVVRREGIAMLRALLSAPLCHQSGGQPHGTLKSLAGWCAERRADLRLHFAKTGTHTTEDPNATVDAWITGGLQFANGAAYSYVVLVGTGTTREPWARALHASQVGVPLLEVLLEDLQGHARAHPQVALLPPRPSAAAPSTSLAATSQPAAAAKGQAKINAREFFDGKQRSTN